MKLLMLFFVHKRIAGSSFATLFYPLQLRAVAANGRLTTHVYRDNLYWDNITIINVSDERSEIEGGQLEV